ncbi:hypothetical protein D9619_004130 [Psilocybe cf. subviscida]|uniref:Uncharacterized protein n=1 Tax=Psilocybe cf. subviscida TaxID=2480587 RepID=A0A8H5F8H9_9AGAR|nr:hypothetical protein D9619_004130 [Psilocybe cf. subviscida]
MPDLPVEIWNYILDYAVDGDIDHLLPVNRVFFYRVMYNRWCSVTLPITGFREEVLARIQDPFVSKHVRTLHIVVHFDIPELPSCGKRSMRNPMSLLSTELPRKFIKTFARPTPYKVPGPMDVLNIVAGIEFPCTEEIRVTTSTAAWPHSAHASLRAMLPSISRNVNSSALRALSLHASLPELQIFLQQEPAFPTLLQFELEIKQPESLSESRDDAVVTQYLVPFINTARLHLRRLSVKSYYSLDLTNFFANLSTFPSLRTLNISRAFNKTDIYPISFTQTCFQKFPALACLFLPVIPRQRFHTDLDRHDVLYEWLRQCITNERCFEGLKYFDIYPTAIPPALNLLLTATRSNAHSLEQMQIRGRFFEPEEVVQLLQALAQCSNLKGLRMNVKLLDITVFRQLTSTLVALETLILGVDTVSVRHLSLNIPVHIADDTSLCQTAGIARRHEKLPVSVLEVEAANDETLP